MLRTTGQWQLFHNLDSGTTVMPLPKYQKKDLNVAIGKIKNYRKKPCSLCNKEMHLKTQQLDIKVGDTFSLVERYVYCIAKNRKNENFAY
jgi:hypothetical protein